MEKFDDMYNRFDSVPQCDRQIRSFGVSCQSSSTYGSHSFFLSSLFHHLYEVQRFYISFCFQPA